MTVHVNVKTPANAEEWHDVIRMFADECKEKALLLAQRELCRLHGETA